MKDQTHQALKGFLDGNSGLTFFRFQQPPLHGFALEEVGRFFFRFNLERIKAQTRVATLLMRQQPEAELGEKNNAIRG